MILIGKAPVFYGFDRRCREKSVGFPLVQCSAAHAPVDDAVAQVNAALEEFAARSPGVRYLRFQSLSLSTACLLHARERRAATLL